MNKTIMAAIRAHALEESPRECCGFIIQSGRRQRYIPVTARRPLLMAGSARLTMPQIRTLRPPARWPLQQLRIAS